MKTHIGKALGAAALIGTVIQIGCTVGPDYKRPITGAPSEFRAPEPGTNAVANASQLQSISTAADLGWWDVFKDPQLQTLVHEALTPLIRGEHPQAIAVLLVQLDPEVAAAVLHALPPEHQPEIVHRIATLEPVSPEALVMLDELLTRRIAERHGSGTLAMGGPREAADIINGAGKAVEKRVLPEIAKLDKLLARKIEEEMFKFEHLFVLDANPMGALLRETDNDTLIDALKGVAENERECFFRAMSSRAADGVRDEIAARGRTKLADVVEAQKRVVAIARKLAAEGTIVFGSGDGDYV